MRGDGAGFDLDRSEYEKVEEDEPRRRYRNNGHANGQKRITRVRS